MISLRKPYDHQIAEMFQELWDGVYMMCNALPQLVRNEQLFLLTGIHHGKEEEVQDLRW